MPNINLAALFNDFPLNYSPEKFPEIPITGIAIDSRKIQPGDLFVVIRIALPKADTEASRTAYRDFARRFDFDARAAAGMRVNAPSA